MSASLLYLSRGDVQTSAVAPREAREAVLQAFRDHAAGLNQSLPKSALDLGPGHGFQAMVAASASQQIAALKWVGMIPVAQDHTLASVNALICVSDFASGMPLAVLDGDEITLLRTAALSSLAALYLAPPNPRTIGFIGCGRQAHAHLTAFRDLYPGLATALAFSRSRSSAEHLAEAAAAGGLGAEVQDNPGELLARSDIVISTVPGAAGLRAFLDARLMKPASLACAVDAGRSWRPETLTAFQVLATDSLAQSHAPIGVDGHPVTTVSFHQDLVQLVSIAVSSARECRSFFCFRGFALADLAVAHLVIGKARAAGLGVALPR